MTIVAKLNSVLRHPGIIRDIFSGKSRHEIRDRIIALNQLFAENKDLDETENFIRKLKSQSSSDRKCVMNCLCNIEDWARPEINEIMLELQTTKELESAPDNWRATISHFRTGLIHRKDWEWAMGIAAMKKFGKLNNQSIALGIGAGKEAVLFYLANHLSVVYATDLYSGGSDWESFAPSDFPSNPKKFRPFSYREEGLRVLKMDGTKIGFPTNTFDLVFSFSSIEHFGGENHSGALESMREMERVLKPGGIATVSTEYIINYKPHHDFFNEETIYSQLIDKLDKLRLVEPIDKTLTPATLATVMDVKDAVKWDMNTFSSDYKRSHPYLLLRTGNILLTSVLLVFRKHE
jgi:SAM-dependent methyltransferase